MLKPNTWPQKKSNIKSVLSSSLDLALATLFLIGSVYSIYITIPFTLRLSKFINMLRSQPPPAVRPEEMANILEGMHTAILGLLGAMVISSTAAIFYILAQWGRSRQHKLDGDSTCD